MALQNLLSGHGNKWHKLHKEETHFFKKFFPNIRDGFHALVNKDARTEFKNLNKAAKNNKAAEAAQETIKEVNEKPDSAQGQQPVPQQTTGEQPAPQSQPQPHPQPEVGGGSAKINSEADADLIADYNKYADGAEKYNAESSDNYYETLTDTLQTDNLVESRFNTDTDAILEYQNAATAPKSRVNENAKLEVSNAYSDDEHINIVKEFHKLGAGE